jgi:hypothetical protein
MGISGDSKLRNYTISSALTHQQILDGFNDVSAIQYLSEADEVLTTYLDGVSAKTVTQDMENGTFTIAVSIDPVERALKDMDMQLDDMSNTIVMISMM